ncbi:MAG: hypothetical protein BWY45_02469 [Euryarchaeota archaeon ADurb.Bin294]|nr:MAG: hypothetical protein BWY45_02469 [Euryarchaeota archaeon ADurb.Bin294]
MNMISTCGIRKVVCNQSAPKTETRGMQRSPETPSSGRTNAISKRRDGISTCGTRWGVSNLSVPMRVTKWYQISRVIPSSGKRKGISTSWFSAAAENWSVRMRVTPFRLSMETPSSGRTLAIWLPPDGISTCGIR